MYKLLILSMLLSSCSNRLLLREYQISINDSTTIIYSKHRIVGIIPFDSSSTLDKLLIKDNL
jgi:hypothetical protein